MFHFFFFSSRRRHTRWPRDWSSDVCSSDLPFERQSQSAFQEIIDCLLGVTGAVAQIADRGLRRRFACARLPEEENDVPQQAVIFIITQHVIFLTGLPHELPFKEA